MLQQPYVNYIMDLAKETDSEFIKEDDVKNFSYKRYTEVADQLEDLYRAKETNESLDLILNEIKEHGTEYVKEKYGLNDGGETNSQN